MSCAPVTANTRAFPKLIKFDYIKKKKNLILTKKFGKF